MMIERIIQEIREMRYEKAYLLIHKMSLEEKWEILSTNLYDEDPMKIYLFMLYMISIDGNESEWHYYCASYLIFCHPLFDDSMGLASWHIKQAIKLNPKENKYKEIVIHIFYGYPEEYFTQEDYYQFANDIIKEEKDNPCAKEILKNLKYGL